MSANPVPSSTRPHDTLARPLLGRTALVTGSTRGIGLGVARELLNAGVRVMLNGRGDDGERVAQDLARFADDGQVDYAACDLRDPHAPSALVAACHARLGGLDILVNNAGVQHVSPIEGFADEHWERVLGLNLSAAFRTTRAALPAMRARGFGRIVNMASVHALVASVDKCAYVASKHGLVGLTKAVALECADDGITCNAVCPGWVRTDLVQAQVDRIGRERGLAPQKAEQELLRAKQPLRRFTTPQAIGALVVFLCGEAGATTTGAAFTMDGGWSSV